MNLYVVLTLNEEKCFTFKNRIINKTVVAFASVIIIKSSTFNFFLLTITMELFLVFQMFNMRNTKLDGEVRFSKSLKAFKSEVQKYIEQQDSVDSRAKSPTSTIEVIIFTLIYNSLHNNYLNYYSTEYQTNCSRGLPIVETHKFIDDFSRVSRDQRTSSESRSKLLQRHPYHRSFGSGTHSRSHLARLKSSRRSCHQLHKLS